MNNCLLLTGAAVVAGAAVTAGTLAAVAALANSAPAPAEDDPTFNCWTMGNRDCGAAALNPDVAVPGPANDGVVYVNHRDGRVRPASPADLQTAWTHCVTVAVGSDASLHACDDDYGRHYL